MNDTAKITALKNLAQRLIEAEQAIKEIERLIPSCPWRKFEKTEWLNSASLGLEYIAKKAHRLADRMGREGLDVLAAAMLKS